MQYCINHPEEMSKLSKLKAQITDIKEIMMDNIEKVPIDFCFQSFFSFSMRLMLGLSISKGTTLGGQVVFVMKTLGLAWLHEYLFSTHFLYLLKKLVVLVDEKYDQISRKVYYIIFWD